MRATDQALLDPCRWDQAASRFSVQNETSLSLLPVQLERGKLIRVRIVDHRPMVSGSKAPPPIAGLWNDQGLFTTLPGKNAGSAQRVHEVYIPAEKSQQLTVSAPKGRVVSSSELHDETGNTARFQVRMEKTEKRPREIVLEVHPN